MFSPANRSSSLLSLDQSEGASLPPGPQVSKIVGSRPKSAVIGYLTEFRGHEVTTRKLSREERDLDDPDKQVPGDDSEVNLETPIQNSSVSSPSTLKKKKIQSNAVLAPSNTRVIGKKVDIALSKGGAVVVYYSKIFSTSILIGSLFERLIYNIRPFNS